MMLVVEEQRSLFCLRAQPRLDLTALWYFWGVKVIILIAGLDLIGITSCSYRRIKRIVPHTSLEVRV